MPTVGPHAVMREPAVPGRRSIPDSDTSATGISRQLNVILRAFFKDPVQTLVLITGIFAFQ